MALPIFKDNLANSPFMLMQTSWKSQLDPVLANPVISGIQLNNVLLATGVTSINHLLGRMMQGWFITDQNASAAIYRSLAFNAKTLTLTSSAPVTVSLWVY